MLKEFLIPVSIPFKRESTSKREDTIHDSKGLQIVSIPFKRESTSKHNNLQKNPSHPTCFNSLQTGKHIQTGRMYRMWMPEVQVSIPFKRESTSKLVKELRIKEVLLSAFQFPSNGKAHPNRQGASTVQITLLTKFQFPSNGKAHPN